MLRKLYKHEFVSLYRILLPLYGVLLGLSVLTRFVSFLPKGESGVLDFWKGLVLSLSIMLIVSIFVVGSVVIVVRFYQNMLSKQGYLTNTLPFKTYNHIICKLICGLVVEITNVIVAAGSLLIMLGTKKGLTQIWNVIKGSYIAFRESTSTATSVVSIIEIAIIGILSLISGILMFYACMAIGQQFKNKILGSVIAYFCIYAVIQVISTAFVTTVTVLGVGIPEAWVENATITTVSQGFIIFLMFVQAIQAVVYYLITNYFLSKKLNLE